MKEFKVPVTWVTEHEKILVVKAHDKKAAGNKVLKMLEEIDIDTALASDPDRSYPQPANVEWNKIWER